MGGTLCAALLAAVFTAQGRAASLTLSGLLDGEDGRVLDLDARVPVTGNWTIGGLFASADAERWRDPDQLRSTTLRAEVGWMSESGIAVSALVADRQIDIDYTATVLGRVRNIRDAAETGRFPRLQRDAVTGDETHSVGVTFGIELGERFVLDTLAGISDSDRTGSVGWGGLALTLRTSRHTR